MIVDDLKDKVRESAVQIWNRIQESSLYIRIAEKYTDMNPGTQRLALAGSVVAAVFLILAFPLGYIISSSESVGAFEEKKQLLRELYRVQRASSELDTAPATAEATALVSQAQTILTTAHIPPELIKNVREFDNAAPQAGSRPLPNVPKAVLQKGVEVSLSKMNLRQVVDLGFQLQGMSRGLKMTGLTVDAVVTNPHYYDVVYQLVSFNLPSEPEPAAAGANGKPGKGPKGRKPPVREKKPSSDETGEG